MMVAMKLPPKVVVEDGGRETPFPCSPWWHVVSVVVVDEALFQLKEEGKNEDHDRLSSVFTSILFIQVICFMVFILHLILDF